MYLAGVQLMLPVLLAVLVAVRWPDTANRLGTLLSGIAAAEMALLAGMRLGSAAILRNRRHRRRHAP